MRHGKGANPALEVNERSMRELLLSAPVASPSRTSSFFSFFLLFFYSSCFTKREVVLQFILGVFRRLRIGSSIANRDWYPVVLFFLFFYVYAVYLLLPALGLQEIPHLRIGVMSLFFFPVLCALHCPFLLMSGSWCMGAWCSKRSNNFAKREGPVYVFLTETCTTTRPCPMFWSGSVWSRVVGNSSADVFHISFFFFCFTIEMVNSPRIR